MNVWRCCGKYSWVRGVQPWKAIGSRHTHRRIQQQRASCPVRQQPAKSTNEPRLQPGSNLKSLISTRDRSGHKCAPQLLVWDLPTTDELLIWTLQEKTWLKPLQVFFNHGLTSTLRSLPLALSHHFRSLHRGNLKIFLEERGLIFPYLGLSGFSLLVNTKFTV